MRYNGPRGNKAFANVPIPDSYDASGLTPEQISQRLPVWAEGDPAHGMLVVNGRGYLLRSKGQGGRPQYATNLVPENATELGLGFTGQNVGHVEAQAAALLQRLAFEGNSVGTATLHMNRPFVCTQVGFGCGPNLPTMLPPGTTLSVYGSGPVQGSSNFLSYFRKF